MPKDWKSLTDDWMLDFEREAEALIRRLDAAISRADEAIENARTAAQKHRRQQKLMTALTAALALATVLYVAINVVRTYQVHRGNQVHARVAETAMEQVVPGVSDTGRPNQ